MNTTIRFYLNGELVTAASAAPTTTVLDYLRERLHATGTKEGCAEGDCGACTVMLAELDGDEALRLRTVNACIQFLPTLDGKAVFTSEGLAAADGRLHPAQQAMVDYHGAQCGFCTPGFVMSLFGLFKRSSAPDRAAIDHALSGNLCRCTGYRPIIDAARRMYDYADGTSWLTTPGPHGGAGEAALIDALKAIQRDGTLALDADGRYFAPRTLAELTRLVSEHPDATLLAGGTDVGLWVTKQFRDLSTTIYIGDVDELDYVDVTDEAIEIGARVRLDRGYAGLCQEFPELAEIARRFASPPICSAGTLVGNVANGSPIGDSMPALLCLDTEIVLRGADGERTLPLSEFYLGYQQTALARGEFVRAIRVPRRRAGMALASYKISKRFDQDISAVCGAFAVTLAGGTVKDCRIAFGGMAAIPRRAAAAEAALTGRDWNEASVTSAAAALAGDYEPMSDMRASSEYRRQIAGNLLLKFYFESAAGEPARVFDLTA